MQAQGLGQICAHGQSGRQFHQTGWSSDSPSSSSASSMPSDRMPRSLAAFKGFPSASTAPTGAKGYNPPARTLGAPHTTRWAAGRRILPPTAAGRPGDAAPLCSARPTTTPEKPGPTPPARRFPGPPGSVYPPGLGRYGQINKILKPINTQSHNIVKLSAIQAGPCPTFRYDCGCAWGA